jgi:hypothetical protein
MRGDLDMPIVAAGPLVAAALATVHVALGAAALVAVVALALALRAPRPSRSVRPATTVAVAPLMPRRARAATEVSVAAVVGAGVRAIPVRALERGRVRRVGAARRGVDASVVTAGWRLATRTNQRLTDAFAEGLGLAAGPLPTLGGGDPDMVLVAATWPA